MKKFLYLLPLLLCISCASVTPRDLVAEAIPSIPVVMALVTREALALGVSDPAQRQTIANELYSTAHGFRSLMGGTLPDAQEVQAMVEQFAPSIASKVGHFSMPLANLWASFFPNIQGDPKLAFDALEAFAEGCERGAQTVLDAK